jgi:hypothetical protein
MYSHFSILVYKMVPLEIISSYFMLTLCICTSWLPSVSRLEIRTSVCIYTIVMSVQTNSRSAPLKLWTGQFEADDVKEMMLLSTEFQSLFESRHLILTIMFSLVAMVIMCRLLLSAIHALLNILRLVLYCYLTISMFQWQQVPLHLRSNSVHIRWSVHYSHDRSIHLRRVFIQDEKLH